MVDEAIGARVFPAAAVDVGRSTGVIWSEARGGLTFESCAAPVSVATLFDLASLTKVIATTTVVMTLVERGLVRLDERVAALVSDWRRDDRAAVTVRDLLEHASGLPARLVDAPPQGRREFEHDICTTTLEYAPRTTSIYSDLGFILLGFIVADRGGAALAEQFSAEGLTFGVPARLRSGTAPTVAEPGDARRGRTLAGEAHDDYAAALGGVAGHAGLFGSAVSVGAFARLVLRASRGVPDVRAPFTPAAVAAFMTPSTVPGSSRALGWDTMLPTSSCGSRMSPRAFGHVGFTGTSIWIDPARDRYFVLLTNRVCEGGTIDDMRAVRRAFHDALGDM